MNIYEKLLAIQSELKAPKTQYNSFGKYNYRNCEDILEAVKPICKKYNAVTFLSDEIVYVEGRWYVRATATIVNCEKPEERVIVSADAREEEKKAGMDGSQITGSSSSYARKYALNGLFDIDDTKDSDTTNTGDKPLSAVSTSDKASSQSSDSVDSEKEKRALSFVLKSGKYKGLQLKDCPIDFLEWASGAWNGFMKECVDIVLAWKNRRAEIKEQEVIGQSKSEQTLFDFSDEDIPF